KDFIASEKKRNEDELRVKEKELASFLTRHTEFAQELGMGGAHGGAAVLEAEKKKKGEQQKGTDPELLALEREAARLRQRLSLPTAPRTTAAPQRDPRLVAAKQEAEAELLSAQ